MCIITWKYNFCSFFQNPSLKPKLKDGEEDGEGPSEELEVSSCNSVFSFYVWLILLPACCDPWSVV